MANRFLGEIAIAAGEGKSYSLRLDFNAMCEFEEATGRNALEALSAMESGKGAMLEMRALMWAALRRHHPDVTLAEAGDLLSNNVDALVDLIEAATPAANTSGGPGNAGAARAKKSPRR